MSFFLVLFYAANILISVAKNCAHLHHVVKYYGSKYPTEFKTMKSFKDLW